MKKSRRILVAEDQVLIALDLSFAIEDTGNKVIGPVSKVQDALRCIEEASIDGAILDMNLTDGDSGPLVERLMAIGTPFVIQTGLGLPPAVAARFPDLNVYFKPCDTGVIVSQLMAMIDARKPAGLEIGKTCVGPGATVDH
jgi:DNA-binding NtrC family response regulator